MLRVTQLARQDMMPKWSLKVTPPDELSWESGLNAQRDQDLKGGDARHQSYKLTRDRSLTTIPD